MIYYNTGQEKINKIYCNIQVLQESRGATTHKGERVREGGVPKIQSMKTNREGHAIGTWPQRKTFTAHQ